MTEIFTNTEEDKRHFLQIAEDCENLLRNTEKELFMYKDDKVKLKEEILKILQENQILHAVKRNSNANSDEIVKHEKLTNEAIDKLKGQIQFLREERDTVQTLWKTSQETILSLENEISNYRNEIFRPNAISDIKQKYSSTIYLLENTIKNIRKELDKQIAINKEILKSKDLIENQLKFKKIKFEEQSKELADAKKTGSNYSTLKEQLNFVMRTNTELEKSLALAKKLIDERFFREKEALEKVQEALSVAERAVAEKEEAFNREIVVREECDHLATTIGQVMEEAAIKVEKNVNELKRQYDVEIEKMKMIQNESSLLLENQKQRLHLAEVRSENLEKKLKEVLEENLALDADLQVASQAIVEMELKIEAIESLMDHDKKFNKVTEQRENEIKRYLLNNQQLKERWKSAIQEVTNKFEKEIVRLQKANRNLVAENEELKLKLIYS